MSVEIKVPDLGESVSEAVVATWVVGDGEYVEADAVVVELETDKAMMEILAETSGTVSVKVEEGESVEVGTILGAIEGGAAPAAKAEPTKEETAAPAAESKPSDAAPAAASSASSGDSEGHGPAARKLMDENNVDPKSVSGTGKDGRITKGDVQAHLAGGSAVAPDTSLADMVTAQLAGETGATVVTGTENVQTRKPMSLIRRKIAERLLDSQHGTASLTTFNEVDLTEVMATRTKYKDLFLKTHDVKLGFMSFFSKAVAMALQEKPEINAFIDGKEIVYNSGVNLGIAVGTPRGLVVPVIRNAHLMSLQDLEGAIAAYGAKARDNKITPDDMMGGTFTISNGGVYGSLQSTPILNPPQSGILGMHKIQERPMAINGEVKIRPMMYLALTYDHRIVDGEQAVTFLVRVKERLEDPVRMLLEV